MSWSARIPRLATLGAAASAVGLAALALAGPASAATTAPAGATHAARSQARALDSGTAFDNLGITTREAQAVQGWLQDAYGYPGPVNGQLDSVSWSYLQREMTAVGTYDGPIDGIVDSGTIAGLQGLLKAPVAGYVGPVDGKDNPQLEAAFAVYGDTLISDDGE